MRADNFRHVTAVRSQSKTGELHVPVKDKTGVGKGLVPGKHLLDLVSYEASFKGRGSASVLVHSLR